MRKLLLIALFAPLAHGDRQTRTAERRAERAEHHGGKRANKEENANTPMDMSKGMDQSMDMDAMEGKDMNMDMKGADMNMDNVHIHDGGYGHANGLRTDE